MNIISEVEYEIFNDFYNAGELIKKAINHYYPSIGKQNKSLDWLITYVINQENYSLFEFSWYVLKIHVEGTNYNFAKYADEFIKLFANQKYLNLYINDQIIISGNGRSWFEFLNKSDKNNHILMSIYSKLHKLNPDVFVNNIKFCDENLTIENISKEEVQDSIFKKEEPINDYDWLAVNFKLVSKSFLLELLEHRTLSVCQRKDYFDSKINFDFIIDNNYQVIKNKVNYEKLEKCLKEVQLTYNFLVNRGIKRDVLRQILPLGTTSDIIVSGTTDAWKNLFKIKTIEDSHWEIRTVLNDLKNELNAEYNYNF